jgi:Mn2+/Fe2+ NRAMP family transporter
MRQKTSTKGITKGFKELEREAIRTEKRIKQEIKKDIKKLGPGFITGGADNDPAGIVTYTTVGAITGYALLWLLVLATPMMIVIQEMAARIALVTRKGLSSIIKIHYGKKVSVAVMTVLIVVNIATIGADISGMAAVLGLITGIEWVFFVLPVTALIWYLISFKSYKVIRKVLIFLTAMLITYVFSAFVVNPEWVLVAKGALIPSLPSFAFVAAAIGLIGTTISPYMLFWQASDELEEHKTIIRAKEVERDTVTGMIWSNTIAFFIIVAAASTLFIAGISIETVEEAAIALKPLAGHFAYLLFAVGIIVAGFLAVPVLAGSTAYCVSETFGWKEGLNKNFFKAKGFHLVITASLFIGALLPFTGVSPVHFLFYTQVFDGILMPFLVVILLLIANNRKIMKEYANTRLKNFFAILLAGTLSVFDVILILQLARILY